MNCILNFDMGILNFIYDNMRCAFLDIIMPIITLFGESGIFFIVVSLIMMIFPKTRKTGFMMGLSLLIGLIVCNIILKPLVARPRPYTVRTDVTLLVKKLSDFSFPSGHTVASFEVATVLLLRKNKMRIPALVLAVLIAFSRLYMYVHYPTDIIVGIIIGLLSGVISVGVINKLYRLYKVKKKEAALNVTEDKSIYRKPESSHKKFIKGFSVYVVILVVAMFAVLIRTHSLLVGFEKSQPEYLVEEEIKALKKAAESDTLNDVLPLNDEIKDYLGGMDKLPESFIDCIRKSELTYALATGQYDTTRLIYNIFAESKPVVRMTIESSNEKTRMIVFTSSDWKMIGLEPLAFDGDFTLANCYSVVVNGELASGTSDDAGNTKYSIRTLADADVDVVDAFGHIHKAYGSVRFNDKMVTFSVPSNYTVIANGNDISKTFESSQPISKYQYAAEYSTDIPSLVTYEIGYFPEEGFEPKIEIKDNHGDYVDYVFGEKLYIDKPATAAEVPQELLDSANVLSFAKSWSLFMTMDLPGETNGLKAISKYLIDDSYLANAAKAWATGVDITFTSIHRLYDPPFENEKVSNYTRFSDNCFSCDVYLEKKMHIANGMDYDDILNSTIYFVKYDATDDGTDNPRWYAVDIQEIVN